MAIWTRYSSAMSTSNQYIKYRVKLTLNSQNVTNNTSNVTVEIQVWRTIPDIPHMDMVLVT